jgi:hypothetical protein
MTNLTSPKTSRLGRSLTTAAMALALAAGTAIGAAPKDNPLGGPKQQQGSAVERSMDAREGFGMNRARNRAANPQNLMGAAIRALDEAADQALHLTDDQKRALEEIRAEFDQAVKAFREDNAEALQALRERGAEIRELMRAGDESARELMAEIRTEMQAIREAAPAFDDIRESMEAIFTDDQKAFVENAMQELVAAAQERRQRAQAQGERGPLEGMRGDRPGAAGDGNQMGQRVRPEATEATRQLREIAARLQNLPEEDRARITELLEAMIAQVEADRGINPIDAIQRIRQRGAGDAGTERPQRRERERERERPARDRNTDSGDQDA